MNDPISNDGMLGILIVLIFGLAIIIMVKLATITEDIDKTIIKVDSILMMMDTTCVDEDVIKEFK